MPGSPRSAPRGLRHSLPASQRRSSRSISSSRPTSGVGAGPQCLEPAHRRRSRRPPPGVHWLGEALELDGAEIDELEQIADLPPGAVGDHDRVGLGEGLQRGRRGSASRRRRRAPVAAPAPIRSPTTTRPVAMPIRTCNVTRTGQSCATASIAARPARTARSASSSCACG